MAVLSFKQLTIFQGIKEDPHTWLQDYLRMAKMKEWDDATRLNNLELFMEESAFAIVRKLPCWTDDAAKIGGIVKQVKDGKVTFQDAKGTDVADYAETCQKFWLKLDTQFTGAFLQKPQK